MRLGVNTSFRPAARVLHGCVPFQNRIFSKRDIIKHPLPAVRLGLIGDLGQTEDSHKTLLHLDKMEVASVLNVGDLSYADSYQPRWDSWNRLLEVCLLSAYLFID